MNPYEILGVPPNADLETIKRAYRELVKQHHPDNGVASERMVEINAAYAILKDPVKRAAYDRGENPEGERREDQVTRVAMGFWERGVAFGGNPLHHAQQMARLVVEDLEQKRARAITRVPVLERHLERLSRPDGAENLLRSDLLRRIDLARQESKDREIEIALTKEALQWLLKYRYKEDQAQSTAQGLRSQALMSSFIPSSLGPSWFTTSQ